MERDRQTYIKKSRMRRGSRKRDRYRKGDKEGEGQEGRKRGMGD